MNLYKTAVQFQLQKTLIKSSLKYIPVDIHNCLYSVDYDMLGPCKS